MITPFDERSPLPVMDLYDSNLMLRAIQVAKEDYDQAKQEYKDFKKEYGDFISPLQKDMDWYNENVIGKVQNVINNLYTNGIDPLRSVEGRAAVNKAINSINVNGINGRKQHAAVAREYIKNRGALQAQNKFNADYEQSILGYRKDGTPITLENWDYDVDGPWGRYSPSVLEDLQSLVHPSFKEISPHYLTKEEVESRGVNYDLNYDYKGVTKADMERIMGSWLPGVRSNPSVNYHREQARKDLIKMGFRPEEISESDVDNQLIENAITADAQIMTPLEITPNKYALAKFDADQNIRVNNARAAVNYKYDKQLMKDKKDMDNEGTGRGKEGTPSIFREAAAKIGNDAKVGNDVGYSIYNEQHYQWIDPLIRGIREEKGKNGAFAYFIPGSETNKIYKKDVYTPSGEKATAQYDLGAFGKDTYFIPSGQMRAEKDKEGNIHYYITGTMMTGTGKNDRTIQNFGINGGSKLYEMEVTERYYNYGKKQSGSNSPSN